MDHAGKIRETGKKADGRVGSVAPQQIDHESVCFHHLSCNAMQQRAGIKAGWIIVGTQNDRLHIVEFAVLGEVTSHACPSPKVNQNLAHGCTLIELQV